MARSTAKRRVRGPATVVALPRSTATVATHDGVRASVEQEGDSELLRVRGPDGGLLFEHDAATGRTVIAAPTGDLELRADHGHVRIVSARSVSLHGGEHVDVHAERSVTLSNGRDEETSRVRMDAHGTHVRSQAFEANIARASVTLDEGSVRARVLETTAESVKQVVGVLETHATRIVARAKNYFAEVTELAQTRAGRIRAVAEDTYHLFGRRTLVRAREDVKIKGDKIYLA